MKRVIIFSLILFSILIFSKETSTIAILPFDSDIKNHDIAIIINDFITVNMYRSKLFNVISPESVRVQLKEKQLAISGCTTEECFKETGQALSANYIIQGKTLEEKNILQMKVIDVIKGQVIYNKSYTFTSENIENISDMIAKNIIRSITNVEINIEKDTEYKALNRSYLMGTIIGKDDYYYWLNIGRANLVGINDILYIIKNNKKVATLKIVSFENYKSKAYVLKKKQNYTIKLGDMVYIAKGLPVFERLGNYELSLDMVLFQHKVYFSISKRRIFNKLPRLYLNLEMGMKSSPNSYMEFSLIPKYFFVSFFQIGMGITAIIDDKSIYIVPTISANSNIYLNSFIAIRLSLKYNIFYFYPTERDLYHDSAGAISLGLSFNL